MKQPCTSNVELVTEKTDCNFKEVTLWLAAAIEYLLFIKQKRKEVSLYNK